MATVIPTLATTTIASSSNEKSILEAILELNVEKLTLEDEDANDRGLLDDLDDVRIQAVRLSLFLGFDCKIKV